jgi:hypothetical protein
MERVQDAGLQERVNLAPSLRVEHEQRLDAEPLGALEDFVLADDLSGIVPVEHLDDLRTEECALLGKRKDE